VTQPVAPLPAISFALESQVPPPEAWDMVTEPERVALWFTDASPVGPVGSEYRLDFGDGSVVLGTVLAVVPGISFAHTWAWEGNEPEQVTRVAWLVEPLDGGGSRIVLVHDGWTEAGADEAARTEHEAYWRGYFADLRDVLAEG
jgi:uncharacterized protein YndB with AHSA1/START domain